MKPLIKWAGGKSNEIKFIEQIIPPFDRYVEPFFGGGALFFDLEPKKAIINDISTDLIDFYRFLKNGEALKKELSEYVKYWGRIGDYMEHFGNNFIMLYNKFKVNKISENEFEKEIDSLFEKKIVPFNGLFKKEFCIDQKALQVSIKKNLIQKLKRTKDKVDVKNHFSDEEIMKNIETAFRSGFYIHFREAMNKAKKGKLKLSKAKRVANYYFVREFCYGGMFRFNSSGDFNVPYGGIAYNTKDFKGKVERLFSNKVKKLFKNTIVENLDFADLLKKYNLTKKDFMFLDPPYDTEFSDYEENPFTKKDQERLADCLIKTKARFILIIKETDFIRKLYEKKNGISISSFDKTYAYNIRGRNVREVKHLIIHNFKEPKLSNY